MFRIEDFERKLFNVETGGEGEAAPAAGGTVIGGAGETGAEGEGDPGKTAEAGANTAGEGTTEETTQEAEGKPEGEGEGEATGAPETYEDFSFPEGYEVNQEALGDFAAFAKERNMTQDTAQEILDYYTKNVDAMQAGQAEAWDNTRKQWVDSAKKDEEFGGQQFDENMKHVATAMKQFGSPELRDLLNETGLGDSPDMIRFFYRVGKLAGEGDFHTGTGGSAGERDAARTLYPNMN